MEPNLKHTITMNLIQTIQSICAAALPPDYSFEYETSKMMNVQSDNRHYPMAFMEEFPVADGRYSTRYNLRRSRSVEISFMRLGPRDNPNPDAIVREMIRDRIEDEAIVPFIKKICEAGVFETIEDFRVTPEPPRFDANAVSMLLVFTVTYKVC